MEDVEYIAKEIRAIRKVIREIQNGARSATVMSPGGGQRAYTNHDLTALYARERELVKLWRHATSASVGVRRVPDFGS